MNAKKPISVKLLDEVRARGLADSMKRCGDENASSWIREAIDIRLMLEGRGFTKRELLSGSVTSSLENASNTHTPQSSMSLFSDSALIELTKVILRNHAMSKRLLEEVLSNPNLNSSGLEFDDVYRDLRDSANRLVNDKLLSSGG
ncbi:hypothetical protein [Enterovibrio paralichthyis]|uniref:hypothetical protein n=1 Tax=Enterovibrio paralichthyis TaxID=2853805 RepID=UPI001C440EAF|nr:hypothetical protein [Enterovibrio paralichthyis]MBV7300287.1 hypothetical protein [Enterovibrio paralichthyis]